MKQRITYVVKDPESFSPDDISVKDVGNFGTSFVLNKVQAAKEQRITLGLDELPEELKDIFNQLHELHIRWASSIAYQSTPPFTSRVSPGLHVFFTPLENSADDTLCYWLRDTLHLDSKCSSTQDAAIKMPILSERFSMSASLQYFTFQESLNDVMSALLQRHCSPERTYCTYQANEFSKASYLDIDYDTISRGVVITAGWSGAQDSGGWTEEVHLPERDATVEVGVLTHELNADPEDIQFGGFLTVLGRDDTPKATRFQTPTRHYPLLQPFESTKETPKTHPLSYTASFSQPTGLHPTLVISFPKQHLQRPEPSCKLHTHLTLPSYLFIDKYQFNDGLFLQSRNLKSLRSLAGATDLEAPDWVIPQWGSAALFELAHPKTKELEKGVEGTWNVSIPLHLRYLPASPSSHTSVPVPWPVVFWACRAEEGAKMAASPFDRLHLGYEALFGPKTRFMHVEPDSRGNGTGHLVEWINVPILDLQKSAWVEAGTIGTVIVAFLGLCLVLFTRGGSKKSVDEARKKKQ